MWNLRKTESNIGRTRDLKTGKKENLERKRGRKSKRQEESQLTKKKKKLPTAPGVPRRSPIQVLTGPDVA